MRRAEYRIVPDTFAGYEVQYRTRFLRFWRQAGWNGSTGANTHCTLEAAERFAHVHAQKRNPTSFKPVLLGWLP